MVKVVGKGGHFEKVHLRPLVKRVVVALRAFQSCTEEDPYRIRHVIQRHPGVPDVIRCGRILENKSVSTDQSPSELIVRRVGMNLLTNPLAVDQ